MLVTIFIRIISKSGISGYKYMTKHFKKITSEIISQNPWWLYKHDTYELPNGAVGDYYYVEKTGGAMVIPVLDDGRLVLIRQFRYLFGKYSLEFPCGGVAVGESPNEAAVRELREQTGYEAEDLIKVGTFEGLNAICKNAVHVFVAHDLEKVSELKSDSTEFFEVLYRRPDEFGDLVRQGEVWDGLTLSAWALAKDSLTS